jgi:hypothetical protein
MAQKSEIIEWPQVQVPGGQLAPSARQEYALQLRVVIEIAVIFWCIMIAIWTPTGRVNAFFWLSTAALVITFAAMGRWGLAEMGVSRPLSGTAFMLAAGALLCAVVVLSGMALRFAGQGYTVAFAKAWQYAIWSLAQEFILQVIFFLRLEALLGTRRAVPAAAFLFALAHLPSPILTVLSFAGGLLFCEFFRRWRNLYSLGVIHAALGLTIAASLPDKWLHHMRVGIGY